MIFVTLIKIKARVSRFCNKSDHFTLFVDIEAESLNLILRLNLIRIVNI